jgi:outer membrane protein assembly factor BamB
MYQRVLYVLLILALLPALGRAETDDNAQWANRPGRNMVVEARNLPAELDKARVLWRVDLRAKWAFAQPAIVDGRVYVGLTSKGLGDPRLESLSGGGGAVVCYSAEDGEVLWKLICPHGGYQGGSYGVGYPPTVVGDRVYVRGIANVFCLDADGLADGNDGMREELEWMAHASRRYRKDKPAPSELVPTDADILWVTEIERTFNASFHDSGAGAVLVQDDFLWVPTSHEFGVKAQKGAANVPNLLVLNRHTGQVVARDGVEVPMVFHGQWSSPSMGEVNGRTLVFWPDGYGVLHAFAPPKSDRADETGPATLTEVWRFDLNPPEYRFIDGKEIRYSEHDNMLLKYPREHPWYVPGDEEKGIGPGNVLSTPVFYKGRVYIGIGRDGAYHSKAGEKWGRLVCIDPSGSGDISTSGLVWEARDFPRTHSTVSIVDDVLYVADQIGGVHCYNATSGSKYWSYDTGHKIHCRSQLVADGKIYVANDKGEFFVLAATPEEARLLSRTRIRPNSATPTAIDGLLLVLTSRDLTAYAPADDGGR